LRTGSGDGDTASACSVCLGMGSGFGARAAFSADRRGAFATWPRSPGIWGSMMLRRSAAWCGNGVRFSRMFVPNSWFRISVWSPGWWRGRLAYIRSGSGRVTRAHRARKRPSICQGLPKMRRAIQASDRPEASHLNWFMKVSWTGSRRRAVPTVCRCRIVGVTSSMDARRIS